MNRSTLRKSSRNNLRNTRRNFRQLGGVYPEDITIYRLGEPPQKRTIISWNLLAPQYCGWGMTRHAYADFLYHFVMTEAHEKQDQDMIDMTQTVKSLIEEGTDESKQDAQTMMSQVLIHDFTKETLETFHTERINAQLNLMENSESSVFLCQEFSPEMYSQAKEERFGEADEEKFGCAPGCMLYVSPDGAGGFFKQEAEQLASTIQRLDPDALLKMAKRIRPGLLDDTEKEIIESKTQDPDALIHVIMAKGVKFRGGEKWQKWITSGEEGRCGEVEGVGDHTMKSPPQGVNYVWENDMVNSTTSGILWKSTIWTEVNDAGGDYKNTLKEKNCFKNVSGYINGVDLPGFTVAHPHRKVYDWKSSTIVVLQHKTNKGTKVVFCSVHLSGGQDESAEKLFEDTYASAMVLSKTYRCSKIILGGDFNRTKTMISQRSGKLGEVGDAAVELDPSIVDKPTVYNADYGSQVDKRTIQNKSTIQRYDWILHVDPVEGSNISISEIDVLTKKESNWKQENITSKISEKHEKDSQQLLHGKNLSDHLPIQFHCYFK